MEWTWNDEDVCGGGGGGDVSWVEVAIYSWNCPIKSYTHLHTQIFYYPKVFISMQLYIFV